MNATIFFICLAIPNLILFGYMLNVMEKKGMKVTGMVTPGRFLDYSKIIREETDPRLKRRYRLIFWFQLICIPVFLIGMYTLT